MMLYLLAVFLIDMTTIYVLTLYLSWVTETISPYYIYTYPSIYTYLHYNFV